jgi:hypothetical protein
MIIYSDTVGQFNKDVFNSVIAQKLENLFIHYKIGKESINEYRAWNNSLMAMSFVLLYSEINKNLRVAVEYQIPLTSKRVDFLISGLDSENNETVVAIELKQWDSIEITSLENCVKAYVGGKFDIHPHPSQQIYSYCQIISNFNLSVQEENIKLIPCAFLHNYPNNKKELLLHDRYEEIVSKAPVFTKNDGEILSDYISKHVLKPTERNLFEVIDNGKLKPSKALQDAILPMLEGKEEFSMIDEQLVAYATITKIVKERIRTGNRYTIIVQGGPGTGKSVIAIHTMAKLLHEGYACCYMTKNSAPREVFKLKLVEGHKTKKYISDLLKSPITLERCNREIVYPCILVDEAHRLTTHYGNDQIDDIIKCSQISVFFIDEDQKVTVKDIGTIDNIIKSANKYKSKVILDESLHLKSQFRCNGSDGYISFLDSMLQIRQTENSSLEGLDYDVVVFDDISKLRDELKIINDKTNKARIVAGYCYEWVSENNPNLYDIYLPDYKAQWNLRNGQPFAISDTSFEQVGCIHTCQGLEFDYVGVIIGKDLRFENGKIVTDKTQVAMSDKSSGIRTCKDNTLADRLIRNTYKTLLSRGQKGCYIYCEDKELAKHIKDVIGQL